MSFTSLPLSLILPVCSLMSDVAHVGCKVAVENERREKERNLFLKDFSKTFEAKANRIKSDDSREKFMDDCCKRAVHP